MTAELKNRIVKLHNILRNKVASGKETLGENSAHQPPAVRMEMMVCKKAFLHYNVKSNN